MARLTLSALLLAALAACSGPATRIDLAPVASSLELRALVGSAMVRTVSLPTYAAAEEISQGAEGGLIVASGDILWADDPERAVTLAVTSHLDEILNATIGPDPWPFAGLPDVSIDVRVARMLAGADGVFRLSGQYYIGGDGIDFPNRSRAFAFEVPLAGEGPGAVAAAQAQAILALSEDIARRLAR